MNNLINGCLVETDHIILDIHYPIPTLDNIQKQRRHFSSVITDKLNKISAEIAIELYMFSSDGIIQLLMSTVFIR